MFALCALFIRTSAAVARSDVDKGQLSAVLDALVASDPAKEQNLFCRGVCHLAKFSHRLNSVDIETIGAKTLLDILASFPGMVVKKDHFGRPTLGLYGLLGQSRLQILIDGVRQNDPWDGTAILNLPAFVIDYLDVYYGPGGTWFGEGSLLGVVAVFTKQLPEIRQFSHVSTDGGLGGGLMATFRQNRIRSGAFASFSVQNPSETFRTDNTASLYYPSQQFSLKDLTASGFFDFKISNTAQAHMLVRSTVSQEFLGEGEDFGFGKYGHRKLVWISDVHLLKKRAQKNVLDLFFSTGVFKGTQNMSFNRPQRNNGFNRLEDSHYGLRFELGTKFHVKPFHGHDLFFGVGGILQGIHNAHHALYKESEGGPSEEKRSSINFGIPARIFGRPSALFVAPVGHAYGFIQDEWQIRAPLLFTVGSRLILPIESQVSSTKLLPNIGVVLIPINKLRFTIAFQTSMRVANLYEQSDRWADAMASNTGTHYDPVALDSEKSRTIETSVWYGDAIGNTHFKASIAAHLSKIDGAINTSLNNPLNNRNEIHMGGLRSVSEVTFSGGHTFSLGIFYTVALQKEFDEQGYSTCHASFFSGFSSRRQCPLDKGVPRLMLRASVSLDMASAGSLTFANFFMGHSKVENLITEPLTLFDVAYISKPIWRYLVLFATAKTAFFGHNYEITRASMFMPARAFAPAFLGTLGLSISL